MAKSGLTLFAILFLTSIGRASVLYGLAPPNVYTITSDTAFTWPIFATPPNSLTVGGVDLASDWRTPTARLWATDTTGDDQLMLINPAKGSGSIVGFYGFGITGPTMRAIAFDVTRGKLFGVARSSLNSAEVHSFYEINPTTAAATLIGSTGFSQITAMGTDLDGNIFAVSTTGSGGDLITIDPTTGAGTFITSLGLTVTDLAVRPEDGQMFATAGSPMSSLYTLNPTTGATTLVGSIAASTIQGIAFLPEPSLLGMLALSGMALGRRRITSARPA